MHRSPTVGLHTRFFVCLLHINITNTDICRIIVVFPTQIHLTLFTLHLNVCQHMLSFKCDSSARDYVPLMLPFAPIYFTINLFMLKLESGRRLF